MRDRLIRLRPKVAASLLLAVPSTPVLAGLFALLCLVILVSSLPFSVTFSLLHSERSLGDVAVDLNNQRTASARAYFARSPKRTLEELRGVSRPEKASFKFTIAIVTVRRRKPAESGGSVGYVLQSAASVDAMVKAHEAFRDSFVFVCNVDRFPQHHEDAAVLKDYLPYAERYGSSSVPGVSELPIPGTEDLYRNTQHGNSFDKERHDYTFCLQVALSFRSQYFLILQDDAVLRPDFADVLLHNLAKLTKPQQCLSVVNGSRGSSFLLHSLLPSSSSSSSYATCLSEHPPYMFDVLPRKRRFISPSPNSSFACLKLYYPERWAGFAFEPSSLLDLASLAGVGGGLGLLLHALLSLVRRVSFEPAWRAFLLGLVTVLLLCEAVGRQNVNELRRVSRHFYRLKAAPSCCLPAVLYPAPVVPFLVTWLAESAERTTVDLRVAEFFRHYDIPAYYIEPNVVRHVGMVTSLYKLYVKPMEEFVI